LINQSGAGGYMYPPLLHKIDSEIINLYYDALVFSHNHPQGSTSPSGQKPGGIGGDIPFAKAVSSLFMNQPVFKIFTTPNNYTTYYPQKK
jgi:hypothetical protein